MTTARSNPLRVGQVVEGLLDDANAGEDDQAIPVEASTGSAAASSPALPVALWERMMAAVDVKFDGDRDGDLRGKG